jgi:hypothetical protein
VLLRPISDVGEAGCAVHSGRAGNLPIIAFLGSMR